MTKATTAKAKATATNATKAIKPVFGGIRNTISGALQFVDDTVSTATDTVGVANTFVGNRAKSFRITDQQHCQFRVSEKLAVITAALEDDAKLKETFDHVTSIWDDA